MMAGLADIPVIVQELSDSEAVAVALIENTQREELQRLIAEFSLAKSRTPSGARARR